MKDMMETCFSSSASCCHSRLRQQGCNAAASRITTGNTSRCLMVLLFLSAFIGGMGAAPTQQDESMATDVSVLCSECPAGTGVARLCTIKGQGANPFAAAQNVTEDQDEAEDEEAEEMATKCEPCVNGATFSDSASRHSPCRACRTCPAHSRVKRECNATHDTECECDRDHYQEISYQQQEQQQTVVTNELADQGVDESSGVAPTTTTTPHARHRHGASIHQLQLQQQQQQQQPSEQQQPVMSCKSCDLCPHGYGAARACSSTHNTICRKCPTSTYSSVLSATHGCSVCTVCRDDQVTLNECTPIQDTVCADKDMGHPSRRVITKPLDPVVHQQEEEYNNEGIISVYCAILGAIVLGLLIYVVMKQWRLRKAANKLAHFHDPARGHHGSSATVPLNGTAGGHHHHQHAANNEFCGGSKSPTGGHKFECEISPSSSSRRLQQPALHGQGGSEGGSRGSRGSDSEFNAGIAAPGSDGYGRDLKPITQDTRLREICTAKRREMEAMLNARRDHHDWKALARDLGYTSTRIASFEQRAIEKQTGPTRHLFGDWAKREDSTVENLVSSLCNIGRHDVTLLLMPPFNQENHQLTTTNNTTSSHPSRPPHATSSLPRTTATTARCYKPISVV